MYNRLPYGVVSNSVCRMRENCSFAFLCFVNRAIHDGIACYAHFYRAFLVFGSESCGAGGLSLFCRLLLYRTGALIQGKEVSRGSIKTVVPWLPICKTGNYRIGTPIFRFFPDLCRPYFADGVLARPRSSGPIVSPAGSARAPRGLGPLPERTPPA